MSIIMLIIYGFIFSWAGLVIIKIISNTPNYDLMEHPSESDREKAICYEWYEQKLDKIEERVYDEENNVKEHK